MAVILISDFRSFQWFSVTSHIDVRSSCLVLLSGHLAPDIVSPWKGLPLSVI